MKKTLIYSSVIAVIAAGLVSCANDYEKYDNSYLLDNPETMTLQASSSVLELFEETPHARCPMNTTSSISHILT